MLRSLEQEMANFAWKCINEDVKEDNRRRKDEESGLIEGIIKEREIKEEDKERRLKEYYEKIEKSYRSYVKKTTTLIRTNGLANVLAFYRSKFGNEKEEKLSGEKRAYKLLYDHINSWFKKQRKTDQDILVWILSENTSSVEVFQVSKEVLSLLTWMGRFAESELKGEG